MADLAKIKRNVAKMASMQAPEEDIDGYIASEGVTIEDVKNFVDTGAKSSVTITPNTGVGSPNFNIGGMTPSSFKIGNMTLTRDPIQQQQLKNEVSMKNAKAKSDIAVAGAKARLGAQSEKEIATVEGKAAASGERDFVRAGSTLDTNLKSMYRFASEQNKMFRTKPGDVFGIIDKMTPKQANPYKEAFESSSKEASATIARLLIPNMRALQGAEMFKASTANVGSTLSGSINNGVQTMGNGFGTSLSNNVITVDDKGKRVNIQDITIDPKSGKPLSKLPLLEKSAAINRLKDEFGRQYKIMHYTTAYQTDPNIFSDKDMKEFKKAVPKEFHFNNEADAEQADIPIGHIVFISGVPYIKE